MDTSRRAFLTARNHVIERNHEDGYTCGHPYTLTPPPPLLFGGSWAKIVGRENGMHWSAARCQSTFFFFFLFDIDCQGRCHRYFCSLSLRHALLESEWNFLLCGTSGGEGAGGAAGDGEEEGSSTAQIKWFLFLCICSKKAGRSLVCLFPPFSLSLITEGDAQHRLPEGLINAEKKARIFSICSPIHSAMHAISTVLLPPFTVFAGRT